MREGRRGGDRRREKCYSPEREKIIKHPGIHLDGRLVIVLGEAGPWIWRIHCNGSSDPVRKERTWKRL